MNREQELLFLKHISLLASIRREEREFLKQLMLERDPSLRSQPVRKPSRWWKSKRPDLF